MHGGMAYSLKHLSLLSSLENIKKSRHGYPFPFFVGRGGMLLWHAIFWGNHNLTLYIISGCSKRDVAKNMEHLLVDDGDAISQCGNVASGWGCVRAYDQESMKRFSLGSQNLTKLNKMTSSICLRFLMV